MDEELEAVLDAGVSSVMLFGIPEEKDDAGSRAWAEDGVVQRALRRARERYPGLFLITETSACASTPPTGTAGSSAAVRWTTTAPWRSLPRKPCPMFRRGRTWWLPRT